MFVFNLYIHFSVFLLKTVFNVSRYFFLTFATVVISAAVCTSAGV